MNLFLPNQRKLYPSSIVTVNRRKVISFPNNNLRNYSDNASHFMVISSATGEDMKIKTFTEIDEGRDIARIFRIQHESDRARFHFWS